MDRPLCFVSCGVTTAPLIPLLAGRFTLLVAYAHTVAELARLGVRAVEWGEFADDALRDRVAEAVPRLTEEWYARLERRAADLFTFGGRSLAGVALPAVDGALRDRLAEHLYILEVGRALGRSGRLAAAVTHEDVTGLTRAFLTGVREWGVPTVHVPHGVYAEEAVVGADVHGVAHTDLIAVGGPAQRDWFVRRGVSADRLVVTGNPAWDALCVPVSPRPSLDLEPGPVVTMASSWVGGANAYRALVQHDQDRRTRACFQAVGARQAVQPALRLVLKLHPSAPLGDEERLRAMAQQCGARVDLVARDRLADILSASEVLLTLPSTVAIEAVLAGTPVIAVDGFYETDAVLTVPADPAALGAALTRALDGWRASPTFAARRAEFVARYDGPADGRAAQRVARLVEDLAARTPASHRGRTVAGTRVAERLACARTRLASGDVDGALRLLDPALADAADGDGARDLWMLRGEALARGQRTAEAEACFGRALADGPWAPAHAGLGRLLLDTGRHQAAEAAFRQAVTVDPGCDAAWTGLGVLAALGGRVPEATALLARALAVDPQNSEARGALRALAGWRPQAGEASQHLLDLLPACPRRLLAVGAAAGRRAAEIKRRHPFCEVIGIVPDLESAGLAMGRLDQVLVGDPESADPGAAGVEPGGLDLVLYEDVLAAVRDPGALLRRHAAYLAEGGRVIASLPNARHAGVLLGLLRGTDGVAGGAGLRAFTRREVERLLGQADLAVIGTRPVADQPAAVAPENARTVWVQLEEFRISGLAADAVAELGAPHIIYTARKGAAVEPWVFPVTRGFRLLMFPALDGTGWHAGLASYWDAFGARDDVALVLSVAPTALASGEAEAAVRAACLRLGRTAAATADVVIEAAPARAADRWSRLRAAHVLLPDGEPDALLVEEARRCGCTLIATPTPGALRAAWTRARGRPVTGARRADPGREQEVCDGAG